MPLTDAGLTAYHAVKRARSKLSSGSTAVVIGFGGIGRFVVQLLRILTDARVVTVDIDPDKLTRAESIGSDFQSIFGESAIEVVSEVSARAGADVIFDCVGSQDSAEFCRQVVSVGGKILMIGIGDGSIRVSLREVGRGVEVCAPFWGSYPDLVELFALARNCELFVDTETCSIEEAVDGYDRLQAGGVNGRMVVVPD
ncbi:zinc-binding dehydrogenase [Rhodococcus sp. LB1]|uniref:zinc-binding dehydrogenase n=1 Tax=Rhodococcus sp. LB1 TaxID=1807499 RepID=UPI001E564C00|nr:zinc-binding dehydrogenase [Rhodococcus sp. LB1]